MNFKSKPMSRLKTKFQPMPMKELLANIQALPLDKTESSDDDSYGSFVKKTKSVKPAFSINGTGSRDRSAFDRVHVMPTIEASNSISSLPVDIAAPRPPLVVKKATERCLFPEPGKDTAGEQCPPSTTATRSQQEPVKDKAADLCAGKTSVCSEKNPVYNKASELYPPSTPSIRSQQESAKEKGPELCPLNTPICSQRESAKTKAPEGYPPSKTYDRSQKEPSKDKAPERCPPSTPSICSQRESAKEKAPDPCPPGKTYVCKVPATPTHPQTRTSTVQYKSISINGKKYMYIRPIGSGGSSYVYKVMEIATSNEFALKSVNLTCDLEVSQGYLNEVRVLRDLQASDRVVKLYAFEHVKAANTLNLILELGETSLALFLRRHCAGAPPALVLHYWEEMLQAVQQIHAHGIVHADLKPANFLLVSGTLKLIDFGIASKVSSDATSVERSSEKGTFSYISPEALGGDGSHPIKVSFYSDVWSLGCILYSLVYGLTPFANYGNMLKIMAIRDPNHRINYPRADHIPSSLLSVLKQCLRYNGHNRPTVTELLQYNHIIQDRSSIPEDILSKVEPHLTPREFSILRSATVTAEALSYAET